MITVHTCGVHYRWQLPAQLIDQLRLAHDLREDLVTLEHSHEEAVRAVWSSYAQIASLEAELAGLEERSAELGSVVKAERSRQRTKNVKHPAVADLTDVRRRIKAVRAERRQAIGAVREEATSRLKELTLAQQAAQKVLYRSYCTEGTLHWATFNDVLDHHKTAVKRIAALRRQGRPAQLRHHRFDGTGTVAVQLQRQSADPPRRPATIADPEISKWRNVLHVPWVHPDSWESMPRSAQRKAGRVIVRMRCGSSVTDSGEKIPEWLDIPVQQHRMLPESADITGARLTVRREGADIRASLSVTARIPEQGEIVDGPTVAVHLGWRDNEEGTMVATWRSDGPLDIPERLREVVTITTPSSGRIVVPNRIEDRVYAHAETASQRDAGVNAIRDELVAWLDEHGAQPHPFGGPEISATNVKRWESPRRFAWLAMQWRETPPERGIADALEAWRRADKALWQSSEHGRGKALRCRDDLHRQVAALIAGQAGRVVVDDSDIATIAARETDLPNEVEHRIARRRATAAPGLLREAIVSAATREEVPVTVVPAKGLSRVHAACGYENPADTRYLSQVVSCDGCGRTYDQDLSATALMLASAGSGS